MIRILMGREVDGHSKLSKQLTQTLTCEVSGKQFMVYSKTKKKTIFFASGTCR